MCGLLTLPAHVCNPKQTANFWGDFRVDKKLIKKVEKGFYLLFPVQFISRFAISLGLDESSEYRVSEFHEIVMSVS